MSKTPPNLLHETRFVRSVTDYVSLTSYLLSTTIILLIYPVREEKERFGD